MSLIYLTVIINTTKMLLFWRKLKKNTIVTLNLNGNPIGDKGIQAIAVNFSSHGIGDLGFENCNITSVGCVAAIDALTNYDHIASLSFQNNPIDSRCATAIAGILSKISILELGERTDR